MIGENRKLYVEENNILYSSQNEYDQILEDLQLIQKDVTIRK